jgi:hypothetical protein
MITASAVGRYEHIAALFKHLSFAGVKIITLAEGEIGRASRRPQGYDECALPVLASTLKG